MAKKIVCSAMIGKIYWATVNEKNHTMSDKKDVTDDAIAAVFEWFTHQYIDAKADELHLTYPNRDVELVMRKKIEGVANG